MTSSNTVISRDLWDFTWYLQDLPTLFAGLFQTLPLFMTFLRKKWSWGKTPPFSISACQTCSDKNLQTLPQQSTRNCRCTWWWHVRSLQPGSCLSVYCPPNSRNWFPTHHHTGSSPLLTCRMKLGKSKQLCQHFLLGDSQPWVSLKVTRIFGLEIFRTTTVH